MGVTTKIRVQFYCGDEIAMGPGKADLLEAIGREGSISGGARAMGMSYRRAWLLVDAMNRCFAQPLVATVAGGSRESGAHLTDAALSVLKEYRAVQQRLAEAGAGKEGAALAAQIREEPRPSGRTMTER